MISKKGQGLSINVVILAAIAILVLIVLVFLVARSSESFSESTKCVTKGGKCVTSIDCGPKTHLEASCGKDSNLVCCPIIV